MYMVKLRRNANFKSFFKKVTDKKWKKLLVIFVGIFVLNSFISITTGVNIIEVGLRKFLAGNDDKVVEFESPGYGSDEPGSWHITKSADWTGPGLAQIQFDVNSIAKTGDTKKDIILVLDVSGSMSGDKLNKVKEDATELTEVVLSDKANRVALIKFDTRAEVLSEFTNDKDAIVNMIASLTDAGTTNYADALRKIGDVLTDYERPYNTDLVALFLSDGYPCEDTPNQIGEFAVLKENYPYLTVNGIQYEMGSSIIKEIAEISDNQYLAYVENLQNVLFDAAAPSQFYDKFEVNDFIDERYFELGTIENVHVSIGTASLSIENGMEKVTWDLGKDYRTGSKATMTIDVKLKDGVTVTDTSIFPTNRKEDVVTKLPEEPEEDPVESPKTPKLKGAYKVIYDANAPKGCSVTNPTPELHKPYETVTINGDDLSNKCAGYLFKGWEMTDDSSYGTTKVTDETFIMPPKDVTIKGIWTQVAISKSMTGEEFELKYIMPFNGEEGFMDNTKDSPNISNSSGINFGSAASTTNGQGLYVRAGTEENEHPIFYYRGAVTNNNVLFANKCWKIVRTTETGGTKLIYNGLPKDTGDMCANTSQDVYIPTKKTGAFNSSYNSLAYVGYMYNSNASKYKVTSKDMSSSGGYDVSTTPIAESEYTNITNDSTYPYTYDASTNQWTSDTKKTNSAVGTIQFSVATAGEYYFAYDVSSESNYDYVTVAVNGTNKTSAKEISGTKTGTIALGNLTTSDVIKVVYTKDGSGNNGRDNVIFSISKATGETVDNRWLYGNSVTYSGATYTLTGEKKITWGEDISNNHYTCFSTSKTCSTVYYIYYINGQTAYYVELTGSKTIENVVPELFPNDNTRNETSSTIKGYIDTWFSGTDGMMSYLDKLEDTVWCNDRTITSMAGWNPNGGSTSSSLYFAPNSRGSKPITTCTNKYDRFTLKSTVTNNNPDLDGNQMLDYPVGLITSDEARMAGAGSTSYLNNSHYFWTLSPYFFGYNNAHGYYVNYGWLDGYSVVNAGGVRPAISLHSGVVATDGDGSAANPYTVG